MLVKTTLLDVKRYQEGSRLARTLQTRSSVFVPEVNVPSDPVQIASAIGDWHTKSHYRKWRMSHGQGGTICHLQHIPTTDPLK